MVHDEASEEARDVDITVFAKPGEEPDQILSGIEVKAHARKLDVTHVEQLCAKLLDMPSLRQKGIISASGYTAPAIRKAEKRGVSLFELKEWDAVSQPCRYFSVGMAEMNCCAPDWCATPRVIFQPVGDVAAEVVEAFSETSTLQFSSGETGTVLDLVQIQAGKAFSGRYPFSDSVAANEYPLDLTINLTDLPMVRTAAGSFVCSSVPVIGQMFWRRTPQRTRFKTLHRLGEESPLSGACLFELPEGILGGLIVADGRTLHVARIPPALRRDARPVGRRFGAKPGTFSQYS